MAGRDSRWPTAPTSSGVPTPFLRNPTTFGVGGGQVTSSDIPKLTFDSFGNLTGGVSKNSALSAYFGLPKRNVEQDPYDLEGAENFDLPKQFQGSNQFMTRLLISDITTAKIWMVNELFPWRKEERSNVIQWDEWKFDDRLLDRVPEETAPRLLSSRFSTNRVSLIRVGAAFLMEHGFYMTEMGQKHYQMQLKQIANATAETAAYGALFSAMHWPTYVEPYNTQYRDTRARSRNALDDIFDHELNSWACFAKRTDGFAIAVRDAKRAFRDKGNSNDPNYWVIPEGGKAYFTGRPDRNFLNTGVPNSINSSIQYDLFGNATVRESRGFNVGENRPQEDPMVSQRTIGGFNYVNKNMLQHINPKDFRTNMLDLCVYNEDSDDWQILSYKDNFRYFGLYDKFEEDHPPLSKEIGSAWFGQNYYIGDYWKSTELADYALDVIMTKTPAEKLDLFELLTKAADHANIETNVEKMSEAARKGIVKLNHHPVGAGSYLPQGRKFRRGPFDDNANLEGGFDLMNDIEEIENNPEYFLQRFPGQQVLLTNALSYFSNFGAKESKLLSYHFLKKLKQISTLEETEQAGAIDTLLKFDVVNWLSAFDLKTAIHHDENISRSNPQFQLTNYEKFVLREKSPHGDRAKQEENLSPFVKLTAGAPRSAIALRSYPTAKVSYILDQPSTIFSLTSGAPVLLNLSQKQLEYAIQRKGQPDVELFNFGHDDIRVGYLQYSLMLSVLHTKVEQHRKRTIKSNASESETEKALTEALLSELASGEFFEVSHQWLSHVHGTVSNFRTFRPLSSQNYHHFEINQSRKLLEAILELQQEGSDEGEDSSPLYDAVGLAFYNLLQANIDSRERSEVGLVSYDDSIHESFDREDVADEESKYNSVTEAGFQLSEIRSPVTGLVKAQFKDDETYQTERRGAVKKVDALFELEQKSDLDISSRAIYLFYALLVDLIMETRIRASALPTEKRKLEKNAKIWLDNAQLLYRSYYNNQDIAKANRAYEVTNQYLMGIFNKLYTNDPSIIGDAVAFGGDGGEVPMTAVGVEAEKQKQDQRRKDRAADKIASRYAAAGFGALPTGMLKSIHANQTKLAESVRTSKAKDYDSWIKQHRGFQSVHDVELRPVINYYLNAKKQNPTSSNEEIFDAYFQESNRSKAKIALLQRILDLPNDANSDVENIILLRLTDPDDANDLITFIRSDKANELAEIDVPTNAPKKSREDEKEDQEEEAEEDGSFSKQDSDRLKVVDRFRKEDWLLLLKAVPVDDGIVFKYFLNNNIPTLIGAIYARPHAEYEMASVLGTMGGGECGVTLFAFPDFQLADNVAQKMHYGSFTMYGKTVITKSEQLVYIRNAMPFRYLGGNGCSMWDPLNLNDIQDYQNGSLCHDIFNIPVPMNWDRSSKFIDITGVLDARLEASAEANAIASYPNSYLFADHWNWQNQRTVKEALSYSELSPTMNTLCFQLHQGSYNQVDKKLTCIQKEQGHWGSNVYPGCGLVRKQQAYYFNEMKYDQFSNEVRVI